jgi:hypothetical protein
MKRDSRSRRAKPIDKEPIDPSGVRPTRVKAESDNVGFVVTLDDDGRVHIQFDVMSDGSPSVGFKFKYRCLRCGHPVPAAFVGSDQPECLKAIEERENQ